MSNEDDALINSLTDLTEELSNSPIPKSVTPPQPWDPDLIRELSYSVLGFTLITLVLCTVLLWKRGAMALDILRVFGIIAIVGVSAVLLITGYSNDQLTPIVGLFGAIAGYLLGKDQHPENPNKPGG